jgi:hypothetical protein
MNSRDRDEAVRPVTSPGIKDREGVRQPRSAAIVEAGVKHADDFANLMSAVMVDILEERISIRDARQLMQLGKPFGL